MVFRSNKCFVKFSSVFLVLLFGNEIWASSKAQKFQRIVYSNPSINSQPEFCVLSPREENFPVFYHGFEGVTSRHYYMPRGHVLSEEVKKDLEHIVAQEGRSYTEQEAPAGFDELSQAALLQGMRLGAVNYARIRCILRIDNCIVGRR